MNESAKHGQNGKIIAGLQHESRQLRELQIENEELKSAVQDYHNAVELIMSKYRSHTGQLLSSSRLDLSLLNNEHQNKVRSFYKYNFIALCFTTIKFGLQIIEAQTEKINEMAAVMMEAANCVEKEETHLEEIITRLKIENQVFL